MDTEAIREQFDIIAKKYDRDRRYFIPCFDDFYSRSLSLLRHLIPEAGKIADLGAGTGLLSMELYKIYPDAEFVLIDLSAEMMEIARQRFEGLNNFSYLIGNYINMTPDGCDIIASALSIHHLENDEKQLLHNKIYDKINRNGCFINLDQFCGDSSMMAAAYDSWWYNHIENSGLTDEAIAKWISRKRLDRENSCPQTVEMLKEAGFEEVECTYSFMKFSTIAAVKR